MKKVILLVVLALAVTFVNAQDTTKSTKKTTTKTNPTTAVKATKTPVNAADLLQAIKNDLDANYKDYKVTSAAKIVKGDVTIYHVNVEKGTSKFKLTYDAEGKFLKKETPPAKTTTTTKTAPKQEDQKK